MNRPGLLLIGGFLTLGIVAGISGQDNLFLLVCVTSGTLVFLAIALPALGILARLRPSKNDRLGNVLRPSVVIGSGLILTAVALVATGSFINRWKVAAVEDYVSKAVPVLDKIKVHSGVYPINLPTDMLGEPPSLLRDSGSYIATSESFRFEYINEPAGWAGGEGALKFDSSTRQWVEDR